MPWQSKKIAQSVDKMLKRKDIAKLNEQFSTFHTFYEASTKAAWGEMTEANNKAYQERDVLLQTDNNWKKFSDQLEGFLNGPKDNSEAAVCKWIEDHYWAYRFLASADIYKFSNGLDFITDLNDYDCPSFGFIRLGRTFLAAYASKADIWGSNNNTEPSEANYKNWQKSNYKTGKEGRKPTKADIRKWKILLAGKYEPVKDPEAAEQFQEDFTRFANSLDRYKQENVEVQNVGALNDAILEERRKFYNVYDSEIEVELRTLSEGPKGADHRSMFEWVSHLPAIIARRDTIGLILADRKKPLTPQQEQLVDLAKTWYEVFQDRQACRLIAGGSYTEESVLISEETKAAIPQIEAKYYDWAKAMGKEVKEPEKTEKAGKSDEKELEPQSDAPKPNLNAIEDFLKNTKKEMDQSVDNVEKAAEIFIKAVETAKDGLTTRLHLQLVDELEAIYVSAWQKPFGKEFADIVDEKLKTIAAKEFESNRNYKAQLKIRPKEGEKAPEPQKYFLRDRNMFELVSAEVRRQALSDIAKNKELVSKDPTARGRFKDILLETLKKGGIFLGKNAPKIAEYYYAAEGLFGAEFKKQIDDAIKADADMSRTIAYCLAVEARSLSGFSRKKDYKTAENLFRSHMVKAFKELAKHKDELESNEIIKSAAENLVISYVGYGKQMPEIDAIVIQDPKVCKSVVNNLLDTLKNGYEKKNITAAHAAACVRKIQTLDPESVLDETAKDQLAEHIRNFSVRFGKNFTVPLEDPVDYFREDFTKLNDHLKELVNAKTTFNSGEYKNIINTVRQLNEKEFGHWGAEEAGLPRKQNHAAKLLTVKKLIDEYIQHKADDGVKKNTYHKLAAVESLNKFVTDRIKELDPASFTGETLKKLNGTLANLNKDISSRFVRDDVEPFVANANIAKAAVTDAAECVNCLNCMQRIIDKAGEVKSPEMAAKISGLKTMQRQFKEYPGDAEVSEYKAKGYLLHEDFTLQDFKKSIDDGENMLPAENESLKNSLQRKGISYGEREKFVLKFGEMTDPEEFKARIITMQGHAEDADSHEDILSLLEDGPERLYNQRIRDSKDEVVVNGMKTIVKDVVERLPGFIDETFRNINTDKDLVREWPKLKLAVNCYRSVFKKPHEKQEMFEKYEQQMKGLEKLAKPAELKIEKKAGGLQNSK